jgi:hypothetical protein
MGAAMNEQRLASIDATRSETGTVPPAPDSARKSWRADIGDRICCVVFASLSLAVIAWGLWTAYWLPALR